MIVNSIAYSWGCFSYCREFSGRRVLTMEWIRGTKPPWSDSRLGPAVGQRRPQGPEEARLQAEWAKLIAVGVQVSYAQPLFCGCIYVFPLALSF